MEQIQILKALPEHTDHVATLIKESFTPYEPLCVATGYSVGDFGPDFINRMGKIIEEGLSFVAVNGSGRVVGCRISSVKTVERTDPDSELEPDYIHVRNKSAKGQLRQLLFRSVTSGWTRELPQGAVLFDFVMLCVAEGYGGRGIGEKLVQRSLELAEQMQVDYVSTIATNWKTQRIFDKLGFETRKTKKYSEFLDADGNEVLKITDGSTCMKWMVKKIRH